MTGATESHDTIDFEGWVCPVPLRDTPFIVMGHGGGGAMSAELIEHLFLPAYGAAATADLGDCAVLSVGGSTLAFSTDSFVVKPMFFPGGSIGDLAVNGTVNDLAMSGATPLFMSTAFILQEGTSVGELGRIAQRMGAAALAAGVRLHGCTVHWVSPDVDEGPIIAQSAVPVLPGDDEPTLAARVLMREHALYPAALRLVAGGAAIPPLGHLDCAWLP